MLSSIASIFSTSLQTTAVQVELNNQAAIDGTVPLTDTAAIVELSAQAQLLAANEAEAETVAANNAAVNDEIVFQQNMEQLAALNQAARAQQNQAINAQQFLALSEVVSISASNALQSAIEDNALSEAIAATNTISSPAVAVTDAAAIDAIAAQNATALNDIAPVPSTNAATVTTATPVVPETPEIPEIPPAPITPDISSTILATDPEFAAVVAAYNLGDNLMSEGVAKIEKPAPQEQEEEIVEPIPAMLATELDLHDSARDDIAHGVVWNWKRVNPGKRVLMGF